MNRTLKRISLGACVALVLSMPALAQWSIGAPGTREAPPGQNRYAYLVMSDPLPGREFDFNDNRTPRPTRYIMLDFAEPMAGVSDADFEAALASQVREVLALPGWMAAQRFRLPALLPGVTVPRLTFTRYLVIWETEGSNAQGLQDARIAAGTAGGINTLAVNPATAQSSWGITTSPFIT